MTEYFSSEITFICYVRAPGERLWLVFEQWLNKASSCFSSFVEFFISALPSFANWDIQTLEWDILWRSQLC